VVVLLQKLAAPKKTRKKTKEAGMSVNAAFPPL
jgi:hypothetical protein